MSLEFRQLHNPYFDPLVREAHGFTNHHLGVQTCPIDMVTVINNDDAAEARKVMGMDDDTFGGGFNVYTGNVVTFAKADPANIPGATVRATSALVHELVHSGTANDAEPLFFDEILAGIAEDAYLQWLRRNGRRQTPDNTVLRRAGVALELPGRFRYYEPGSKTENTSTGLVAIRGMRLALQHAGTTAADLLDSSSLGGTKQYDLMKRSLDSLQPDLADKVATFPDTFDGVVLAATAIQAATDERHRVL